MMNQQTFENKQVIDIFIKSSKNWLMHTPPFSIKEAKQQDMVDYLQQLGYLPHKIREMITGTYRH